MLLALLFFTTSNEFGWFIFISAFMLEFLVLFVKYATAKILRKKLGVPQQFVHHSVSGIRVAGIRVSGIRSRFFKCEYPVSGIRYPAFLSVSIRYPVSGC